MRQRINQTGTAVAMLVIVVMVVIVGATPAAAAPRAFLLYDPSAPGSTRDFNNMYAALEASGWTIAAKTVKSGVTSAAEVNLLVSRFFDTPPGNGDLKLLYYTGHGGPVTQDGDPVDLPPVDEPTSSTDDESFSGLRDDAFPDLDYSGRVVGIFDACEGGGVFDGSDIAIGNAHLLSSAGPDETIVGDQVLGGAFTVFLIRALMPGEADVSPDDGMITPSEIDDYVAANWPPAWDWSGGTPDRVESSLWKDEPFFTELPPEFPAPATGDGGVKGERCEAEMVPTTTTTSPPPTTTSTTPPVSLVGPAASVVLAAALMVSSRARLRGSEIADETRTKQDTG